MKRKLMLLLACLLASIGLSDYQIPKKVTGVVISEKMISLLLWSIRISERYNDGNSHRYR